MKPFQGAAITLPSGHSEVVSLDDAQVIIASLQEAVRKDETLLGKITVAACSIYGVSKHSIMGRQRSEMVCKARNAVLAALAERGFSRNELAAMFHRDTSAISHALAALKDQLATSQASRDNWAEFKRRIA